MYFDLEQAVRLLGEDVIAANEILKNNSLEPFTGSKDERIYECLSGFYDKNNITRPNITRSKRSLSFPHFNNEELKSENVFISSNKNSFDVNEVFVHF